MPKYKRAKTSGGMKQNRSLYVTMRDGVRIAIDLWLPRELGAQERIPAVIRATRYIRALEPGLLTKLSLYFGAKTPAETEFEVWDRHKMALVLVDVRGTGASFGTQRAPWSPEEIADLGEIVDYIVSQPWSDGQVAAYGVSYHGNTAEMITTTQRSALKAVAPLFSDFDPYMLARTGGLLNEKFVRLWNDSNQALDANDIHRGAKGFKKLMGELFYRGACPVDGDRGRVLLKQATAEHEANINVYTASEGAPCCDDEFGGSGLSMADVSPYTHRAEIESSGVPMFVAVGISDAETVDGAVERYRTYSNPQRLIIGPWSHGANAFVDPLLEHKKPEGIYLRNDLIERVADFFAERFVAAPQENAPEKHLTYYIYGDGAFRESDGWPFAVKETRLYPTAEGGLGESASSGQVKYHVDYTAATGEKTRWFTQMTGGCVDYGDRREADKKLLSFTSVPLDNDAVIAGKPVLELSLCINADEGAVIAYLEDIAPDGRAAYLTEGEVLLSSRKGTFLRGDRSDVTEGETLCARVNMFTLFARIRAGHRVRVSIAGHDASNFRRYPESGKEAEFTVALADSFIELPLTTL